MDEIKSVFGGNNYLFDTNPHGDQLREVQVLKALKEDIGPFELYDKTGLKLLLHTLLDCEEIRSVIKGGFIEVSTIASTLHENKLDAFNLSFADAEDFNNNVSSYFKAVIKKLRNRNLILFNHPDFSIRPDKIFNFFSIIDGEKEIYDNRIIQLVNKNYSEIIQSGLNSEQIKGKHIPDKICNKTYKILIRKSNLDDKFTTYEGLTNHKSDDVKNKVEKEFGSLSTIEEKLFATHFLNHTLYHNKFQEGFQTKSPSIFISVPLVDPDPLGHKSYKGLGAFFIFLLLDENIGNVKSLKEKIEQYCFKVVNLVRGYLPGYIFQIGIDKLDELKKQATKSAIAAVMSRNMSHNIGSHVLVKLSEKSNVESAKDVAEFNGYLKHRMSFIADLSTSQSSINGLSFIDNEILDKFRNLKLLKSHISGNDSVNADSLRLNYGCDVHGLNADSDLAIQIPADTIGKQAVYVFIENFIRNAVKYSIIPLEVEEQPGFGRKEEYKLDIHVHLSQPENEELRKQFYIIDIFDNSSKVNFDKRKELELFNEDKPGPQVFKLLKKLQNDIDRSVLENGAPRIGGWGILEMKICAAFLRKHPLKYIDICPSELEQILPNKQILPNILTAHFYRKNKATKIEIVKADEHFGVDDLNLGYRFYLLKPKKIAFPRTEFWLNGLSEDIIRQLELYGIYFIEINKEIISVGIDHEIIAVDKSCDRLIQQIDSGTQRILTLNNIEIEEIRNALRAASVLEVENLIWKSYCNQNKYIGEIMIFQSSGHISLEEKKTSELIIFDHHGEHLKAICDIVPDNNSLVDAPVFYYEKFGSESGTGSLIEQNKSETEANIVLLNSKFKEVAHIEIVVIDERIQRAAYFDQETIIWTLDGKRDTRNVLLNDLLQKMKIWVPNSKAVIDLDKQSFEKVEDKDLVIIEDWIDGMASNKNIKFILIHLSIIEKLKDASPASVEDFYNRWTAKWGHKISIIIISGRGEPSTIPNGSYFIPYDCIEEYLLRNRSKFNLINLIYSTNKKNGK